MNTDELLSIQKATEDFLSQNKTRYHLYKKIQEKLINLTQDTYQETLQLIQKNVDILFKDHPSTINFIGIVNGTISKNFINLEIILDIIIHFSNEIYRANVTNNELYKIFNSNLSSINYLYSKQFFSIQAITEFSKHSIIIFINFMPDIYKYDGRYAKIREKDLFVNVIISNGDIYRKFKDIVKSDPQLHIKNRQLNYYPSNLHKSIREDDIDTFQSLLSQNQIDINYRFQYSFYERSSQNKSTSLIQVATIYGAVNICKFLLMQINIKLDDNLLSFAYTSHNFDLIHSYEKLKCSSDNLITTIIFDNQKDLLEYYLENYSDHIIEDNENIIQKLGRNFSPEDNIYYQLNYDNLESALYAFNYSIIKKCLPKIVYIVKNVELTKNKFIGTSPFIPPTCLLIASGFDFELFKFLYSQISPKIGKYECEGYKFALTECLSRKMNDAFIFLFNNLKDKIRISSILNSCLMSNHEIAHYLFDLQIKEVRENTYDQLHNEQSLYAKFYYAINYNHFVLVTKDYDECILAKMFFLYSSILNDRDVEYFLSCLYENQSTETINSLVENVPFLFNYCKAKKKAMKITK